MTSKDMKTGEVISMVRDYINEKFGSDTGFRGAYLIGAINRMPLDSIFPAYRDVDIGVITSAVDELDNIETELNGYIVESVLSNPKFYADEETILSDGRYADNIAADSILIDADGELTRLHEKVKASFPLRKWVEMRCQNEMKQVKDNLLGMRKAANSGEFMMHFGCHVMYTTGALTIAYLHAPTHRRGSLQLRDIMQQAGQQDLYEAYLQAFGMANISKEDAESFLEQAMRSFDRAIEVFKTPIPYAYKLEPFIRPYLLEGTRELFAEEGYRESIFWIARFLVIACMVILNDGTPEEKGEYGNLLNQLLVKLGIDSEEARKSRVESCEQLVCSVEAHINHVLSMSKDIIQ